MGKRRNRSAEAASASIEAELRLTGEPEVLKAAFASLPLAPELGVEEERSVLESSYVDTPDLALRARGLAYRVRAKNGGYRQTLKAGDDAKAALLKRGEWETALKDPQPRPEDLPGSARRLLPEAAFEDGLRQVFVTRVRRCVRQVVIPSGGRIEAALDLGEIETGKGDLPIAEIELELLKGGPSALYRLADALLETRPLRLQTRSKSARAFDQLSGRPPSWHRAMPLPLEPDDSVDEAMATIFESCFSQWLANQAAAIDGRDLEGVHQLRVALRRLRSALSAFRKLIPKEQRAWLEADARRALKALGPARDWDVFLTELLSPVMAARPDDPDLNALHNRARSRRKAGYERARKHLESGDYTRFVLRLGQWLEERAWRRDDDAGQAKQLIRPIGEFAGERLQRRHKRALTKGLGLADLSTEKRHALRIALKKLRYGVEFFRPVFGKTSVKAFRRRVKLLQEGLGLLNDVAVAETLMADLLARPGKDDLGRATGLVIGWHAHRVVAAEPELLRDWKAFEAAPRFWC